jgi:uncharacterized membrane protein
MGPETMAAANSLLAALAAAHWQFPVGGGEPEQIILRWVHIVAGIGWIGLLYFFNLVNFPAMRELDAATRARVYAPVMRRAMWWFRWSAVVTWLAGFRYFMILAQTDATAIGAPSLAAKWLGWWFLCWVVASVLIVGMIQAMSPRRSSGWWLALLVVVIVLGAAWLDLRLIAAPGVGNRTLSISLGGGLGTILLVLVWGLVWRFQKRLIRWMHAHATGGEALPPQVEIMTRGSFLAARAGFWISFPMLFFMAASAHYPFLSGQ